MSVTLTEQQVKAIFNEEQLFFPYEKVEETEWTVDGKYQSCSVIFKISDGRHFMFGVSRTGSPYSHFEYMYDTDVIEVKKAEITTTEEQWVNINYQPPAVESNGEPIIYPAESLSNAEKWIYFKRIESIVKKEIEKLKKEAFVQVEANDGFLITNFGKAHKVDKTERKAKESLKTFLAEKGLLNLCVKDDIDLNKVDDLVDAGQIDKSELSQHISVKNNPYLKLGK